MNSIASTSSTANEPCSTGNNQNKRKTLDDGNLSCANANGSQLKIACTDKNAIQKSLKCTSCGDICIPPIFVCATGHHACQKCRIESGPRTKCGICSATFPGTRNFFLENYFESCHFACRFSSEGCVHVLAGKNLKTHQKQCDFRPLLCPSYCARIPFSQFLGHIATKKCSQVVQCNTLGYFEYKVLLDDGSMNIPKRIFLPRQVQFEGHTFFVIMFSESWCVTSYVTILGNEEDANRFRAEIVIDNMAEGHTPISLMSTRWEGPVRSTRLHSDSIMAGGNCFLASGFFLRAVCTSNSEIANLDPKVPQDSDNENEDDFESDDDEENMPKEPDWFIVKCKLIKTKT